MSSRKCELALFFSHGVSLETWERTGLLTKETDYYKALSASFGDVVFVTYDRPSPRLEDRIAAVAPLKVLYNRWRLPYRLFGFLAPLLFLGRLRRCTVLKTNQISGAWTAVIAKWLTKRPLVVRCGYLGSLNAKRQGAGAMRVWLVLMFEKLAVRSADLVFAATPHDMKYLSDTHGISMGKIVQIPTPIDTQRFAPSSKTERQPGLVLFVGRLSVEKNIDLLIDACQAIPDARLRIVGAGDLEHDLRRRSDPTRVEFAGMVPNVDLPQHMADASVFVLPSQYEGSPKALLEAMAAGLPVVGTRVPGIREVIEDGVNGLLADPSAESIAAAIARLMSDEMLRLRLGAAARRTVVDRYSQTDVIRREKAALASIVR